MPPALIGWHGGVEAILLAHRAVATCAQRQPVPPVARLRSVVSGLAVKGKT